MTLQIPYTSNQLQWHLQNNVEPKLNESTIQKIITVCNFVNMGQSKLEDFVSCYTDVTIGEMLDDLKIDYNF